MTNCNTDARECVTIEWNIENFRFCWHKTGERLESPLFHTDFSIRTSWRLWFYPRGEDDAEYVSFYLVREEGGPEVVDVDFQLFTDYSDEIIMNWHSFKIHQREGLKCLESRWKIFSPMADPQRNEYLFLGCRIFCRKGHIVRSSVQHLYTRIGIENIKSVEIFGNITDIISPSSKSIDVISLWEDTPLLNINISYIEDSLEIKILPLNCKKIKYAVCRITIIKSWGEEPSIEHVRSWIGEIKADIWRYRALLPRTKTFNTKALFVEYDFKFSTGKTMENCEFWDSAYDSFRPYLCMKSAKSAPTALDALKENYISKSFVDVHIKMNFVTYPAHKAILCVRSGFFRLFLNVNTREFNLPKISNEYFRDFLKFLYTDTLDILSIKPAFEFYSFSIVTDVELMKTQCRNFILYRMGKKNALNLLKLSIVWRDSFLETVAQNYLMSHYGFELSYTEGEIPSQDIEVRKHIILLKYRKQKTESSIPYRCLSIETGFLKMYLSQ